LVVLPTQLTSFLYNLAFEEISVPPRAGSIRCLLVLDHILLRQGLRRLLEDESDIEVVGEAGNEAECLRKVHELQPEVVITDFATLSFSASEVEFRLKQESAETRVLYLAPQDNAAIPVMESQQSPDCALRQTSAEEFIGMIRKACGVEPSRGRDKFSQSGLHPPTEFRAPHTNPLTAREREVLKLLAEGLTVRGAAGVLGLSVKTVDAHKFNLMRKLGIHNKAELVMWAIQWHVVKVPVNF
jgi:DNA-binding NarL/FixJ family response regulator